MTALWGRCGACGGWLDIVALLALGAVCVALAGAVALLALWAPIAMVH